MTDTRKTVLVVDDEELFLLSLVDALAPHEARFRVVTALSGEDALELIGRLPVDLVITDVRMPGMDGVELVRQLASRHPRLPVIVMTAFSSARLLRELASCFPAAVLEKPLELEELVRVVEQCLLESPARESDANGDRRMDRCNDPEV